MGRLRFFLAEALLRDALNADDKREWASSVPEDLAQAFRRLSFDQMCLLLGNEGVRAQWQRLARDDWQQFLRNGTPLSDVLPTALRLEIDPDPSMPPAEAQDALIGARTAAVARVLTDSGAQGARRAEARKRVDSALVAVETGDPEDRAETCEP